MDLGLPLTVEDETATQQTVVKAAQDYLNTLDAKRSTHMSYENILNQYWLPAIGHWILSEVTSTKIKEILTTLKVSGKTKRNALIPIRGVFDHAEIVPNPADRVLVRKHQKALVERYTPKQRDAILAQLEGQERVYFSLLFGCGLRPGEALALLWTDYDGTELEVSKQITRRKLEASTKTSVRRKVYVPKWVRDILSDHPTRFAKSHILLNSHGRPHLDTDHMNEVWREAHRRAKIAYRVPYVCRHTRASELLSIGIGPADAAKQLGHSPEMFLRIYAEFIEEFAKGQDRARFEGVEPEKSTLAG